MKKQSYLSIVFCSAFLMSLASRFSTPAEVSTDIPESNTLTSIERPRNPSLENGLCKNKYLPIVNDTTKAYAVKTMVSGSTSSSTNYETVLYYGNRNYFTVSTRLGSRVGYPFDEIWDCSIYGLTKTVFEGGEFSAFFVKDENGIDTRRTGDWCPGGVTLPVDIHASDIWTQQTDFKFTSTNLTGWNWLKWNIFNLPLKSRTLPLPAGSGRFVYEYKAIGFEKIIVLAGTYNAFRIDVTAKGYLDPSRVFSPTFQNSRCEWNSNSADQVNPFMTLSFEGSTWWVPDVGWVKKAGTISNSQGVIEGYEMELESFEAP